MYKTRSLTVMHRVTVAEAAKLLGISADGVRMRVRRGTIDHEKDETGRLVVYVDEAELDRNESQDDSPDAYLAVLQEQIEQLRNDVTDWKEQLREEREANRENRRLLAAALERIPAIEPPSDTVPSEPPESPETVSEEPYSTHAPPKPETPVPDPQRKRSWWRAFFGLE
jgi:excisionase family DNA binding protein